MKVSHYFILSRVGAVICILFITLPQCVYAEQNVPLIVRYPASDSNPYYYKRVKYFVEMLELALSKSDHQYTLEKISLPFMNESRSKTNLVTNVYDVHWLNAQNNLDADLLAIHIPLCKGLSGWRILFIQPEHQKDFSTIKTLNDLRHFTAGHGNDWPEVARYGNLELPQKLSGSWKGLFHMLKQNRIDYLSRSALEIYDEEDAFPELNLAIESKIALHYPATYYFYVNKNNVALAKDIQLGLERAIADGSFDKIFNRYFEDKLRKLHLENRQVIQLSTPADKNLVFDRKTYPSYWYSRAGNQKNQ